jgi:energy-coupling factor transport system ATP-binding protein
MTPVPAVGLQVVWQDVRFAYGAGAAAVRGVSLSIGAGESAALVGPNGAGKTTLTRMAMGLVRPQAGHVTVGDWDVAERRPDQMASRVGYVFQHADQQLFARSVAQDVAFGPRRLGRSEALVPPLLEELGLAGYAAVHPYDVPAPVRKVVALAGVLAMAPAVLILDEPTAGLDREFRSRVVSAVRGRSDAGVTVIAISHDRPFIRSMGRVVEMRDGQIAGG